MPISEPPKSDSQPTPHEDARREAIAWIARLSSGEATEEDGRRLMAWRDESAENEAAFREAARLWKASGEALVAAPENRFRLSRRGFLRAGGVAAAVVGAAWAGSYLGFTPTLSAALSDYATAVGEQRRIALADGSSVELDGGSVLNVTFSESRRSAELGAGAALFRIAEGKPTPFSLAAGPGRLTSEGGVFAASIGAESVIVDCLEGALDVDCGAGARLSAGQATRYSVAGLGAVAAKDPAEMALWRKGLLVFSDRALADVASDINRHRRGRVVIANETLAARRISGVFHLDRPDEIIAHLEATFGAASVRAAGMVVLY